MLTLGRFKALAGSYGADLRRWPEALRGEAQALVNVSAEARACLDAARALDEAIEAASRQEDGVLQQPGEAEAALARLRSGVAARIAQSPARRAGRRRAGWGPEGGRRWMLLPQLRWAGVATGGGVAILAGVLIGALYSPAPAPEGVLSLLDPAPIHILTE
jgi:hypothetical protein